MCKEELVANARISTMPELAELTIVADKVLVFQRPLCNRDY